MPKTSIKTRFAGPDSDLLMLVNVCAAFWSAVTFESGVLRVPVKTPHVRFTRIGTLDPRVEYAMCDENGDLVLMHFAPLKDEWILFPRAHPIPMHLDGDIGCDGDCEERVLFKQLCRHETMVSRLRVQIFLLVSCGFIISRYSTRSSWFLVRFFFPFSFR